MVKLENILWLTDFSNDSTYALEYARELAEKFGAKLYLLHIIDNPTSNIYGRVEGDYLAMEKNARERARALLQSYADTELRGFTNCEILLQEGEILQKVLEAVAKKQIGTVVMGTHGRTGLAHMLLGSIAEKVIRSVECPVYVIRHPTRQTTHKAA